MSFVWRSVMERTLPSRKMEWRNLAGEPHTDSRTGEQGKERGRNHQLHGAPPTRCGSHRQGSVPTNGCTRPEEPKDA